MKILGASLSSILAGPKSRPGAVVLLDGRGGTSASRHPATLAEAARDAVDLAGDEAFLLGVDLPVVVPEKPLKARSVENLVRRRLGHRLAPGGRAALPAARGGVGGEALLQALAVSGQPCLPYPDRDRRRSGLAEIHPGLVLKVLLWEGAPVAAAPEHPDRESAFRAYDPPPYREAATKAGWPERAFALDLTMRGLSFQEGLDLRAAWEALSRAATDDEVERAGAILDATLVAATAARYLEEPEACVFLGDREDGYTILPADGFVRRLALRESGRPGRARLFPRASLRERLGRAADLRPLALVEIPGQGQRMEAVFTDAPLYEFDNLDEMLWWKHCRHLDGPEVPVEGLVEMVARLGRDASEGGAPLRLIRSRHRTLSFRFDPPAAWRARVATRDGRTYAFRVMRAVYETRGSD